MVEQQQPPAGNKTRRISSIALAGSGIVHSDSAQTTVSKDSSSNGQVRRVALAQLDRAAQVGGALSGEASIAGLSSTPVSSMSSA